MGEEFMMTGTCSFRVVVPEKLGVSSVFVVGDHEELGNWTLKRADKCQLTLKCTLHSGRLFESNLFNLSSTSSETKYKYILESGAHDFHEFHWEQCGDRTKDFGSSAKVSADVDLVLGMGEQCKPNVASLDMPPTREPDVAEGYEVVPGNSCDEASAQGKASDDFVERMNRMEDRVKQLESQGYISSLVSSLVGSMTTTSTPTEKDPLETLKESVETLEEDFAQYKTVQDKEIREVKELKEMCGQVENNTHSIKELKEKWSQVEGHTQSIKDIQAKLEKLVSLPREVRILKNAVFAEPSTKEMEDLDLQPKVGRPAAAAPTSAPTSASKKVSSTSTSASASASAQAVAATVTLPSASPEAATTSSAAAAPSIPSKAKAGNAAAAAPAPAGPVAGAATPTPGSAQGGTKPQVPAAARRTPASIVDKRDIPSAVEAGPSTPPATPPTAAASGAVATASRPSTPPEGSTASATPESQKPSPPLVAKKTLPPQKAEGQKAQKDQKQEAQTRSPSKVPSPAKGASTPQSQAQSQTQFEKQRPSLATAATTATPAAQSWSSQDPQSSCYPSMPSSSANLNNLTSGAPNPIPSEGTVHRPPPTTSVRLAPPPTNDVSAATTPATTPATAATTTTTTTTTRSATTTSRPSTISSEELGSDTSGTSSTAAPDQRKEPYAPPDLSVFKASGRLTDEQAKMAIDLCIHNLELLEERKRAADSLLKERKRAGKLASGLWDQYYALKKAWKLCKFNVHQDRVQAEEEQMIRKEVFQWLTGEWFKDNEKWYIPEEPTTPRPVPGTDAPSHDNSPVRSG